MHHLCITGLPPEIHDEVNQPDIKFLFDKIMEVSIREYIWHYGDNNDGVTARGRLFKPCPL